MIDDLLTCFGGKALAFGMHEAVAGWVCWAKNAFVRIPVSEYFDQVAGQDGDTLLCSFQSSLLNANAPWRESLWIPARDATQNHRSQ